MPPAGPITLVTESYAAGVQEIRPPAATFHPARIERREGGSTPSGDGSQHLNAAALAPASSASGINHRRTEGRLIEFMGGLPGHRVLREMMQHTGDVLIPFTPGLLPDPDKGRLGRGQVADDAQRVGDLRDPERIGRRYAAVREARVEQRRPSGTVGLDAEVVGLKASPE